MWKTWLKLIFILLGGMWSIACSTVRIVSITDKNTSLNDNTGLVFVLPQTALIVEITEQQRQQNQSSYAVYARKLLPEPVKFQTKRELSAISVKPLLLPDTSEYYIISGGLLNIALSENGIPEAINASHKPRPYRFMSENNWVYNKPANKISYNHLFIKPNTKLKVDTLYRSVKIDSVVVKRPVYVEREVQKTQADVAYDIYRYLIKVRKRRLKLIAGIDTVPRPSETLKQMLHRLDSTEEMLYNLLTGHTSVSQQTYRFTFTPTTNHLSDTLAYWDYQEGINFQQKGEPLIISLHRLSNVRQLPETTCRQQGFPYRVPLLAEVIISKGATVLQRMTLQIPQLGPRYYLPLKTIKTKKIIFSPAGMPIEITDNK